MRRSSPPCATRDARRALRDACSVRLVLRAHTRAGAAQSGSTKRAVETRGRARGPACYRGVGMRLSDLGRGAIVTALLLGVASCVRSSTEWTCEVDTDAPRDRAVVVSVAVRRGTTVTTVGPAAELSWQREAAS